MKIRVFNTLFVLLSILNTINCQEQLPVIRATHDTVDIKIGFNLIPKAWTILPHVKPDIYRTHHVDSVVTFYTDQDSISFVVSKTKTHRFIILLNDEDSAYTEIQYYPSYLELLRNSRYNFSDKRKVPKFRYQSADNRNLIQLCKTFNLDSIAGKGDDISKIKNLMTWVHKLLPHDGLKDIPKTKNASGLINYCLENNKTLNCWGLAIVLNECYLSMGFKSRKVSCIPRDSLNNDNDTHVINTVFVPSLNKWIWVDPTNNAMIMDEFGNLLSIREVREYLIEGKKLQLNEDANYNNKPIRKEKYLDNYMAKNLYMLQSLAHSKYNSESNVFWKIFWGNITYIRLEPTNYSSIKENIFDFRCATNNPDVFWESIEN